MDWSEVPIGSCIDFKGYATQDYFVSCNTLGRLHMIVFDEGGTRMTLLNSKRETIQSYIDSGWIVGNEDCKINLEKSIRSTLDP